MHTQVTSCDDGPRKFKLDQYLAFRPFIDLSASVQFLLTLIYYIMLSNFRAAWSMVRLAVNVIETSSKKMGEN